ncbi:uncharacterized protein LOC129018329 isoform X2 [Pongo pygmaeus]|uniref:uncharacterized protein LOC129018329 isoform X2 n=1 Tax=Pongo pygmaeus TaxID=9600 RepID=UPI00300D9610
MQCSTRLEWKIQRLRYGLLLLSIHKSEVGFMQTWAKGQLEDKISWKPGSFKNPGIGRSQDGRIGRALSYSSQRKRHRRRVISAFPSEVLHGLTGIEQCITEVGLVAQLLLVADQALTQEPLRMRVAGVLHLAPDLAHRVEHGQLSLRGWVGLQVLDGPCQHFHHRLADDISISLKLSSNLVPSAPPTFSLTSWLAL